METTPINEIKDLFSEGMGEPADRLFQNYTVYNENEFETPGEQLKYLVDIQKWKEALFFFEDQKFDIQDEEYILRKIDIFIGLNELDKALQLLSSLENLSGCQKYFFLYKSKIYFLKGEFIKALDFSEMALKKDKKDFFLWYWNGYVLKKNELLKKAKDSLEKSLKLNPDFPLTHYYMGIIHYEMKGYLKSIDSLLKCYDNPRIPKKKAAWYIGQCYERLRKHEEAEKFFSIFKTV